MSFTLCSSGAIVIKAGKNVDTTASTSGAILEQYSNEAEADVNTLTGYDWVSNYANIGANYKQALASACSNLAGSYLIWYDPSGYTSRGEAQDMTNILHDRAMRIITAMKVDNIKTKMGATDS